MLLNPEFLRRVNVALAERTLTRVDLARRLRKPYSTLSCWLNGIQTAPDDLPGRIERVLGMTPGSLGSADPSTSVPSSGIGSGD